jgi:phospholipid transport system substrate-binding protein
MIRKVKYILTAVLLLAFSMPMQGQAQTVSDVARVATSPTDAAFLESAKQYIQHLSVEAIDKLTDLKVPQNLREHRFRAMLQENFDVPNISRFVLGRYWRVATPAQQQEFVELFKEMVVQIYMTKLKDYRGQSLQVVGGRLDGEGKYALVETTVIDPSVSNKVAVQWRVIRASPFKIADVSVEGISMGVSQRSEFSSVIQRGGGQFEALLVELRKNKISVAEKRGQ